jgi:HAD superfamily hydrolase (TIGR01450 family)
MAWICDLDGVLWRGDRAIDGSMAAVDRLRAAGERVLFVSNNSSMAIAAYLAKFAAMGLGVGGEDVCTSAQAAASLVQPGERVLVLGGDGIREALRRRGAEAVEIAEPPDTGRIDTVMVGMDRALTYERLTAAVRTVLAGARLIGTNDDPTFPAADGLSPGAGSLLAAVAFAADVTPVVAGKPYEPIAVLIRERLGVDEADPSNLLFVGDQPRTDGRMAKALGARFALVLSGVTSAEDAPHADPAPDVVAPDLAALVASTLD